MYSNSNVKPLHLHTVESLCSDLVSGLAVGVGASNSEFSLVNAQARSVLQWYMMNRPKWAGNVFEKDCEAIVDSLANLPVVRPVIDYVGGVKSKELNLQFMRAHRFAGLHRYRSAVDAPEDFELNFKSPVTFLEGANGAGKTSILNAIVWALTGQLFRPQRAPESGQTEFNCELTSASSGEDALTFKAVAVVPLPDLDIERPIGQGVVDTWVELTFVDEDGNALPTVRRHLTRTAKGKLDETESGISTLGVDPVVLRSGTLMAALLPYIQFEGPSALGKAVAELTGLAALVQLMKHATKASTKLAVDLTKERYKDIELIEKAYARSRIDLIAQVEQNPSLAFSHALPGPDMPGVEEALARTKGHFDTLSATRMAEAIEVLGNSFNPEEDKDRKDLQDSIEPALGELSHLKNLPSAARLSELGAVSSEERDAARSALEQVLKQAAELVKLAQDGSRAQRLRLYAAVGSWMERHPEFHIESGNCPVCDASLDGVVDDVTGGAVIEHLERALHGDAALVAQTLVQWAKSAAAQLTSQLPTALQAEVKRDLPDHPSDLVKAALGDELWDSTSLKGVLAALKEPTTQACELAAACLEPIAQSELPDLHVALPGLTSLQLTISRLDKAIRFSDWRSNNKEAMRSVFEAVIGSSQEVKDMKVDSLSSRLQKLRVIVESVGPIKQALALCERLSDDYGQRKVKVERIEQYKLASAALLECARLGTLAEAQVDELQRTLHQKTVEWRSRIYQGAWPATNMELVGLSTGTDGRFEFQVGASGVTAPAQHVSNASALRANLIGFYLAYWQYLQQERGGLPLMVLDDPQELLDGENRHRLADSLVLLATEGSQLVVTTHDKPFSELLVQAGKADGVAVDHRSVHPPSKERPTLQTCPSVLDIQRLHEAFIKDENDAIAAREYAAESRVFIETRLGDLFDIPAYHATSATTTSLPTLADFLFRLRGAVKPPASNELFRSPVLRELAVDPALQDRSPTLKLLNRAHHRQKHLIQPADVKACRADLERLRRLVERAHEQLRLFLRRERLSTEFDDIVGLQPGELPNFSVNVRPNLLAYVRGSPTGESQELSAGTLDQTWFEDKAFFFLRTQNFGFASTIESVAVVETAASAVPDRHLVIARRGKDVFARRLLRPADSDFIALASETPDPRFSKPTLQFHQREVALHKVVGMFFHVGALGSKGKDEAVQIDGNLLVERIRSAFKVEEQSAIPLALEGQIALGGATLRPSDFESHIEQYVALSLSDGTTIFKRVGTSLGGALSHVRQFDAIGGLGAADVLAVEGQQAGLTMVENAVHILGVLYNA